MKKPAKRRDFVTTKLGNDTVKVSSYEASLKTIVNSDFYPASARVTAARTLAEIEGRIGRHQAAPERAGAPLSTLSRAELVAELERLRTLMGLGLVS